MTCLKKTTIKYFKNLSFAFTFLGSGHSFAVDNIPKDTKSFNQEFNTNIFAQVSSRGQVLLRAQAQNNEELDDNRSFRLEYRHKFLKNTKALLSYEQAFGLRHNEDWDNPQVTWRWNPTYHRREQIYGLGFQYKKAIDKKRRQALKIRTRLLLNTFNDQQDLSLTLGYIYALNTKNLCLVQSRFNFPVSYARQTVNYYSLYLGHLYFFTKTLSLGPQVKYTVQKWTESLSFKARTAKTYEVENQILSVGLALNYYPKIFN